MSTTHNPKRLTLLCALLIMLNLGLLAISIATLVKVYSGSFGYGSDEQEQKPQSKPPPPCPGSHVVKTSAGVIMPQILYGTAWKDGHTPELVSRALSTGYCGVDTANQPRSYREDLVGEGLRRAYAEYGIAREQLFIETKFTPAEMQDPETTPYDRNANLREQVRQSVAKSLTHLNTSYIDSLLLHIPMSTPSATMEVWRAFEEQHSLGRIKQLGLANHYDMRELAAVYSQARVKPAVLQNKFSFDTGYDEEIRRFCNRNGITYLAYGTLASNEQFFSRSVKLRELATTRGVTREQLFLRFVIQLGIIPITGTWSDVHMREDLAVLDMSALTSEEMDLIQKEMMEQQ